MTRFSTIRTPTCEAIIRDCGSRIAWWKRVATRTTPNRPKIAPEAPTAGTLVPEHVAGNRRPPMRADHVEAEQQRRPVHALDELARVPQRVHVEDQVEEAAGRAPA